MKKISFDLNTIRTVITIIGSYVIAGFLFVSTGGAWTNNTSMSLSYEQLLWWELAFVIIIGLLLFLINIEYKIKLSFKVKKKIFIFFICCTTYLYKFQGSYEWFFAFFFLIIIWFLLFLYETENSKCVWDAFTNIAVIFAIISLFFYFGGTLLNIIPETGRVEIIWGTWDTSSVRTFHDLYYEAQFLKVNKNILIPRNCGIFSEAPMYNFVLCIALAGELFLAKKMRIWKIVVLIFTILTTFSTTGYLFLVISSIFYLINIFLSKERIVRYKKGILTFIALSVIIMLAIFLQKITMPSGVGSVNVRSDHLYACIRAWLESPLIGVGFQNSEAILEYAKYKQGLSMGLMYYIASGGILMLSLILIPYIMNAVSVIKYRKYNEFIFETLFLFLFFFTEITITPILRFFIAYIIIFEADKVILNKREDRLEEMFIGFFEKKIKT